jgi:tetratricopeptide (TPR) repeat protein
MGIEATAEHSSNPGELIEALSEAARRAPADPGAWRALADACFRAGLSAEADVAYQRATLMSVHDPALREAALALASNRLDIAERLIKPHLKANPTDVAAIRMLAELAARIGRLDDAEALLTRAIELAPGFLAARQNMAMLHLRKYRVAEALAEVQNLLEIEPDNPAFINLEGVALSKLGDYTDATLRFEAVLKRRPKAARIWLSYGHSLKTVGRSPESVEAYRRAIELQPTLGEAWWSLANLKSIRFGAPDIEAMEQALRAGQRLSDDDRLQLHFALGKAHEDAAAPELAYGHYAAGNAIRARQLHYNPRVVEAFVAAATERFDAAFFAARHQQGDPRPDPIFIVGMPRAGSTLVEQILASHSMVEGTHELPDLEMLASSLEPGDSAYLKPGFIDALARCEPQQLATLGAQYLKATRVYRKTSRPLFIDKMPNNWAFVPMIRLILPNAKIVDARRSAMACCFSNFKQHFARGQAFSYRLDHLARYYKAYVRLMSHVDLVLPGAVYRVKHEDMVSDTDVQIRQLLDALGLPFEPACLRFWETERAVQTASAEQVRRPIFRDGIDQWRDFDPFLGELRAGLGDLAQE